MMANKIHFRSKRRKQKRSPKSRKLSQNPNFKIFVNKDHSVPSLSNKGKRKRFGSHNFISKPIKVNNMLELGQTEISKSTKNLSHMDEPRESIAVKSYLKENRFLSSQVKCIYH